MYLTVTLTISNLHTPSIIHFKKDLNLFNQPSSADEKYDCPKNILVIQM